jgi:hypothetical protein
MAGASPLICILFNILPGLVPGVITALKLNAYVAPFAGIFPKFHDKICPFTTGVIVFEPAAVNLPFASGRRWL